MSQKQQAFTYPEQIVFLISDMTDTYGPIGKVPIKGRLQLLKNSLTYVPPKEGETYRYRDILSFIRYLKPLKSAILWVLILTFINALLNTVLPLSGKWIIDYIFMKQSIQPVIDSLNHIHLGFLVPFVTIMLTSLPLLITFLALVQVVKFLLNNELTLVNYRITTEYGFRLKMAVFSRVMKYPVSYFKSTRSGYLLGRIQGDTGGLTSISGSLLTNLITAGTTLCVSTTVLTTLSLPLTILVIFSVPVSVAVNYFISRISLSYTIRMRETGLTLSADSQDMITSIDLIKTHAAEDRELSRYTRSTLDSISLNLAGILFGQVTGGMQRAITSAVRLGVMLLGGSLVLAGGISIGDYMAFLAMYPQVTGSITTFLQLPLTLQGIALSATRVLELLELPTEYEHDEPGKTLCIPDEPADGDIRYAGVTFGYEKGAPVLSDVSLHIRAGDRIALCGPTGAGKTTFIHLLLRFYRPEQGTITIDGYDIRGLNPGWIREQIAVVSQDLMLFHDTVMNNIRYSRPDATERMVQEAAQSAGVHEEILRFPEGYQTIIGERGGKLSGGQKQRIAIARAILRDSQIIILDEPTAHLDQEKEEELVAEFIRICQGRTLIVITHRPGLLNLVQRVYDVRDGAVKEREMLPSPP